MFKYIFLLLLVSSFCFPFTSHADETCNEDSGVTSDMVNCARIDYEKSDKKLNDIYKQLMPILSTLEQTLLKRSQIQWIKSKDACDKYNDTDTYGTIGHVDSVVCLTEKTDNRITLLTQYQICHRQNNSANNVRNCLTNYYQNLDKQLNITYQKTMKHLSINDGNVMMKKEIEWIKYKEKTCGKQKSGTSDDFSDIICRIEKTQEQILVIQDESNP